MNTKSSSSCGCNDTASTLSRSNDRALRRVLWIVLWINLLLFGSEFIAGWWIASSGLQADALDSLGDAGVYALSLFVIGRSARWSAGAALIKGVIQGLFGIAVLIGVVHRWYGGSVPLAPWMAGVAAIALVLNLSCFLLLLRFRNQDLNLRSVWLCSRNDVASNLGVIVAAGAVAVVGNGIPDAIIGALIATLFLHTSWSVLRDSWAQWQQPAAPSCSLNTPVPSPLDKLRVAFAQEWQMASQRRLSGELDAAFAHLERAHVLGQRQTWLHIQSHLGMWQIGWQRRDLRELLGQLARIPAAALFSKLWVPTGNTGGANVSAIKPMPVPNDLRELLEAAYGDEFAALS